MQSIQQLLLVAATVATAALWWPATVDAYEVVYAINAGGDDHVDEHGVHYERDPLMDHRIGIASDYGKNLMRIGRVQQHADEQLYQTERYHTATFGYELPVRADGAYLLQLKFCEVYFAAANLKVFDVLLNQEHTVVADLDIFRQVGRGNAHDEHIPFTVANGRLHYGDGEESVVCNGRVRIEFIKGYRDNPKINAIALFRGDVENVPRLPPYEVDDWLDDTTAEEAGAADPSASAAAAAAAAASAAAAATKQQRTRRQPPKNGDDFGAAQFGGAADAQRGGGGGGGGDDYERPVLTGAGAGSGPAARKTSGPKQEDPYALDDSSVMLPVFIAIAAFIPLLFCLCKL